MPLVGFRREGASIRYYVPYLVMGHVLGWTARAGKRSQWGTDRFRLHKSEIATESCCVTWDNRFNCDKHREQNDSEKDEFVHLSKFKS